MPQIVDCADLLGKHGTLRDFNRIWTSINFPFQPDHLIYAAYDPAAALHIGQTLRSLLISRELLSLLHVPNNF